MSYHPTEDLILMAHGNASIRIYDLKRNAFTHHFGGFHTGRINLIKWHDNGNVFFSNALDGFRVFDLKKKTYVFLHDINSYSCVAHLNQDKNDITEVVSNNKRFVTSGHNVLNVYNLKTFELLSTIPVLQVCLT
jgi:WD40 repeat protein